MGESDRFIVHNVEHNVYSNSGRIALWNKVVDYKILFFYNIGNMKKI